MQNKFQKIHIYSPNSIRLLQLTQQSLNLSLNQFREYVRKKVGYSSRIFYYQKPIMSFHRMHYLNDETPIKLVLQNLAITFNNTQYRQESEYYKNIPFSTKPQEQSIQIVLQICQNSNFVHENYRVPISSKLSFIIEICNRYGHSSFVQYYNTRVPLNKFGNDDTIATTILRFRDQMNRLTISTSSVDEGQMGMKFLQFLEFEEKFVNLDKFRILSIEETDERFIIDKKCGSRVLYELFCFNLENQIQILDYKVQKFVEGSKHSGFEDQTHILVRLNKKKKLYPIQLEDSMLIGDHRNSLYFVESSNILHVFSYIENENNSYFSQTLTSYLPAPPSNALDEDLYYLKDDKIVGYSITIDFVKLKYYDLTGNFLYMNLQKWHQKLYEIEFKVVDLFCVSLKLQPYKSKKTVRVFMIDNPQHFIQIQGFLQFFPSRHGFNSFSDGSGLFAVTYIWKKSLSVYSLKNQQKIVQVNTTHDQVENVLLSPILDRNQFCVCYNKSFLTIYNLKGEIIRQILGQAGMKKFIYINTSLFCMYSTQICKFQVGQLFQKWSEPIRIGQSSIILQQNGDKQGKIGKPLMKENTLQFKNISSIYRYHS